MTQQFFTGMLEKSHSVVDICNKTAVSDDISRDVTPCCLPKQQPLSSHFRTLFEDCVWNGDGTRAETRFRLSAKRTSPFKSAGVSVQSTTGNRGVHISGSNAGYTMFRGSVKSTGYPLHSPVLPSLLLPCVTVCHLISTGLYICKCWQIFQIIVTHVS